MADIREVIVLDQLTTRKFWTPTLIGFLARAKLRLRHWVVLTSVPPIRFLYLAIYRLHIWYATRVLSRIPKTSAVYVTRGAASSSAIPGVSDIDLFVMGEWSDDGQALVIAQIQRLARISPLYDRASTHQVHTLNTLRGLFDSDYYFQFRFDQGRHRCKLVFGTDVLAALPAIPAPRVRGGYYMETRMWWMQFSNSAFGAGPTSWDAIFRNSISHKAVAEVLGIEAAIAGSPLEPSREKAADAALPRLPANERAIVERLQQCRQNRYLRYPGDPIDDAFQVLLHRIERIHAMLPLGDPFLPLAGKQLFVDVPPGEVYQNPAALSRARAVIEGARNWAGYRNAFLLPRCSFAGIDDLQLLLEVDEADLPTAAQVREVCAMESAESLPQRLAIYLLLPNGAYLVNRKVPLEFWHVLQSPASNPELFNLLSRPEFVIDGNPRQATTYPWTTFAATLVQDEMRLRRSATARAMASSGGNALLMLRGIWRHLQLDVMERSAATGTIYVPLTVPAILRGVHAQGLPDIPILHELREAYEQELAGRPSNAAQLIPQAIAFFSRPQ